MQIFPKFRLVLFSSVLYTPKIILLTLAIDIMYAFFVRFYPLFELCYDLFYYINNLSAQTMFIHFGRDDIFNIVRILLACSWISNMRASVYI